MPYNSSQRRVYVGVFGLFFLLLGLHYIGWLKPVENIFYRLITPASSRVYSLSVKVGDRYEFFAHKEEFLAKYATCVADLGKEQVNSVSVKELKNENSELKKQLNYMQQKKYHTFLADVIGREIAGAEKNIIIAITKESGIKVGQPVISGEGILVGKISRVEDQIALVRLISDPNSKIEVGIANADQSIGVLEGGYGITLKMKFVPRNEVVKTDDQIVSSGYEPMVPRGLLLGKVAEVQNQASQGFQDISVIPLVNLTKLTQVSVIVTP